MHKDGSTSVDDTVREQFHSDPVGWRVELPDGSLAVVKRLHKTAAGTLYEVRGIHHNWRFRSLGGAPSRYRADELQIVYFTASINPDYLPS